MSQQAKREKGNATAASGGMHGVEDKEPLL
jgi:hypothetical protein